MRSHNSYEAIMQLLTQIHESERKYLDALKNDENNEILKSLQLHIAKLRKQLEEIEKSGSKN